MYYRRALFWRSGLLKIFLNLTQSPTHCIRNHTNEGVAGLVHSLRDIPCPNSADSLDLINLLACEIWNVREWSLEHLLLGQYHTACNGVEVRFGTGAWLQGFSKGS